MVGQKVMVCAAEVVLATGPQLLTALDLTAIDM